MKPPPPYWPAPAVRARFLTLLGALTGAAPALLEGFAQGGVYVLEDGVLGASGGRWYKAAWLRAPHALPCAQGWWLELGARGLLPTAGPEVQWQPTRQPRNGADPQWGRVRTMAPLLYVALHAPAFDRALEQVRLWRAWVELLGLRPGPLQVHFAGPQTLGALTVSEQQLAPERRAPTPQTLARLRAVAERHARAPGLPKRFTRGHHLTQQLLALLGAPVNPRGRRLDAALREAWAAQVLRGVGLRAGEVTVAPTPANLPLVLAEQLEALGMRLHWHARGAGDGRSTLALLVGMPGAFEAPAPRALRKTRPAWWRRLAAPGATS